VSAFRFTRGPIDVAAMRAQLADPSAGGYAAFEGWVRNHNEGLAVRHLEYEAFEALAVKEGERIVAEAKQRFGIEHAACVHRIGDLQVGAMAVWVGVSSRHRHEAFLACRYIIDEVKHRVPIWKKEHYENGDSGWVNCERCASSATVGADTDGQAVLAHAHKHDQHAGLRPDYSRQMSLRQIGAAGQAKLRASGVLIVGCGGLGVPVMSYLAGAGIGRMTLVDADTLEASNLHRQTLYALADVGQSKAQLAAERMRALNPDVEVCALSARLDAGSAPDLITQHDVVIDCTDNFSSKFLLNDLCVKLRKPVVFASVYQYEGQLQVVRPDGACLRCIWPEATRDGLVGNCAEAGVLGPVPATLGSLQALEVLKLLLDLPGQLRDEMLMFDLLTLTTTHLRTTRSDDCPKHAIEQANRAVARIGADATDIEIEFESLSAAQSAGFEIIDIREPRELADVPTPAASTRHIPMAQLLAAPAALGPKRPILLVCASGRRSLAAAQKLREQGQQSVHSWRGGIAGFRARSASHSVRS
jgi:molybdopterin/thiamine biosynthesis adenylyltransferase/molybdopterin synthase catalytic subunit/rhodanese-related sulfurtransferase